MRRNNFGKGKTRVCCNLWQDNKTGKYVKWIKGKWVNVTECVNDIDELLKDIGIDMEDQK